MRVAKSGTNLSTTTEMNPLLSICSDIKKDLQEISKSLANLIDLKNQKIAGDWNRQEDVLKIMGISSRTFGRLIKSGQLPITKINGSVFVKTSDLNEMLNSHHVHKEKMNT